MKTIVTNGGNIEIIEPIKKVENSTCKIQNPSLNRAKQVLALLLSH